MKKLYFGSVRDIQPLANDRYRLTIDDLSSGRSRYLILKLTDSEYEYLLDVGNVPYVYDKHNGRYYVRPLMIEQEQEVDASRV